MDPVGDKNLVAVHLHAACAKVVLDNGLAQKILTLVGRIALQGIVVCHFLDGLFHRIDHRPRDALDHVADPQANHVGLGVGLGKRLDPAGDFWKEVTGFELEIVIVDMHHDIAFFV